jgi:ferritin-like metal-binding protein YciE
MAQETAKGVIKRYLEDAIAAERSFETQLRGMSKEGDQPEVQQLFVQHAEETRNQYERLTTRLEALGGSPSTFKSFLANFFGAAPKAAQVGHEPAEKASQDLMIAFAVENSEIAMYEALATSAEAAGDTVTAQLARDIQQEERRTAEKVWSLLAPVSREAFRRVTSGGVTV